MGAHEKMASSPYMYMGNVKINSAGMPPPPPEMSRVQLLNNEFLTTLCERANLKCMYVDYDLDWME